VSAFITCETTAAVVIHIRRLPESGPNYHGAEVETLCGAKRTGWDTRVPIAAATCRVCIHEHDKITRAAENGAGSDE